MKTIVKIAELRKNFGHEQALKGIQFEIKSGEIFGLLGPSGSGKTTTIKLLTGELDPTSGSLEVLGYSPEMFGRTEYLEKLGILSDKSALYERLTVADNLELYRKLYNTDKEKVDEVLEAVGLLDQKNKRVSKLSKGMKQRILLCKAVLHAPPLLLLDEPTSALDPNTRERIHEMLLKLIESGTTILLTTHDMDEATLLCDNVAFLHEGVIKETGSPEDLRNKYKRNVVHIKYASGLIKTIENSRENFTQLQEALLDQDLIDLHTDFPSLGEVFKSVTGKELI